MELKLLAVAVGGAVGACTRYVVSQWAAGRFGADFPYGTLIVNVVGCFIIGVFLTLTTERLIVSLVLGYKCGHKNVESVKLKARKDVSNIEQAVYRRIQNDGG